MLPSDSRPSDLRPSEAPVPAALPSAAPPLPTSIDLDDPFDADDTAPMRPVGDPHLDRLRRVARVLDDLAAVPGTKMRVGVDPLLGLLPGLGDVVTGGVSAYAILIAQRMGAPASVLIRMAWNVLVDVLTGTVPIFGDLFDFGWKASRKNVRLVERYVEAPGEVTASSRVVAFALVALLLLGIVGAMWLAFALVGALGDALGSKVSLWPTGTA